MEPDLVTWEAIRHGLVVILPNGKAIPSSSYEVLSDQEANEAWRRWLLSQEIRQGVYQKALGGHIE